MDIDIDITFRGCGVLMFKSKYLFCLKYECKISRQFVSYLYFFSDTCGHSLISKSPVYLSFCRKSRSCTEKGDGPVFEGPCLIK